MKIARFIFVTEKYSEVKKHLFADNSPYKYMINVIKKKWNFIIETMFLDSEHLI